MVDEVPRAALGGALRPSQSFLSDFDRGPGLVARVVVALIVVALVPGRAGLSWTRVAVGDAWHFNGHDFIFLGHPDRGTVRQLPAAAPAPLVAACRHLGQLPDVEAIQATANMRMFATKRAVVAGASLSPKRPESFLLTAAREKVRLAPHSWQRLAWMPTREPQAGQSLGRG